jgi:hypothetical protein
MTGSEAAELGFSNGVANSLEELLKRLGFGEEAAKSGSEAECRARFEKGKRRMENHIEAAKSFDPVAQARMLAKWNITPVRNVPLEHCVSDIDQALSELQDLLDIAAACPALKIQEDAIRRKMGLVKQWRQSPLSKRPSGL